MTDTREDWGAEFRKVRAERDELKEAIVNWYYSMMPTPEAAAKYDAAYRKLCWLAEGYVIDEEIAVDSDT